MKNPITMMKLWWISRFGSRKRAATSKASTPSYSSRSSYYPTYQPDPLDHGYSSPFLTAFDSDSSVSGGETGSSALEGGGGESGGAGASGSWGDSGGSDGGSSSGGGESGCGGGSCGGGGGGD